MATLAETAKENNVRHNQKRKKNRRNKINLFFFPFISNIYYVFCDFVFFFFLSFWNWTWHLNYTALRVKRKTNKKKANNSELTWWNVWFLVAFFIELLTLFLVKVLFFFIYFFDCFFLFVLCFFYWLADYWHFVPLRDEKTFFFVLCVSIKLSS